MFEGSQLRVLLADDHPLVREGLKRLIDEQPDMAVVGEASDGPSALALARDAAPDVALVDVSMPGWGGVKLTEALVSNCPALKVIGVTRHSETAFVDKMMQAGAAGYVLKQSPSAELLRALRVVAGGGRYIDPSLPAVAPRLETRPVLPESFIPDVSLSAIEEDVLRQVADAYSTQEIATRLAMDPREVVNVKAKAMTKARLSTRLQVIQYAHARGWR